jgi:hypothetical protein
MLNANAVKDKGKAIPAQALGFQEVGTPNFPDVWHMKVLRLSAICTVCLTPRKYSWYLFLLEAESFSQSECGQKD